MKRTLIILLLIAFVMTVSSCVISDSDSENDTTAVQGTETTVPGQNTTEGTKAVTTAPDPTETTFTTTEERKNLPVATEGQDSGHFGPGVGF